MRKKVAAAISVLVMVAIFGASSLASAPASPAQSGNVGKVSNAIEATFMIHHISPSINKGLVYKGFSATGCGQSVSGMSFWSLAGVQTYFSSIPDCAQGWTYTLDPSVTITNEGHDFIQKRLYNVANAVAPSASDYATILGASSSATAIAVTDNFAAAGPCDSANILTTNGFARADATTKTAGVPSAGSVTTTLAITFSVTNTQANVQAACILTAASGTTYIFGEVAFGPDSFVSGDSLTMTYTMTSA